MNISPMDLESTLIEASGELIVRRSVVMSRGAEEVPKSPEKPSENRTSPAVRVPSVIELDLSLKTHFFEASGTELSDQLSGSETSAGLPPAVH